MSTQTMHTYVERHRDEARGSDTTVTLMMVSHSDGGESAYVKVTSAMILDGRRRWSEPTATEMRKMVDHALQGTDMRRSKPRFQSGTDTDRRTITGVVWQYPLDRS